MKVKEWIEKLKKMPEDAEVYYYDYETGEYMEPFPEFVDSNHNDFVKARKYSWLTVAENNPYVIISYEDSGKSYIGIKLCSNLDIKQEDFGKVTSREVLEIMARDKYENI